MSAPTAGSCGRASRHEAGWPRPSGADRAAANLPVFHKLAGRKAVVAGGSQGALWKAELLAAAGADVLVLAGHDAAAKLFDGLAARCCRAAGRTRDLDGAALAIADLSDRGRGAALRRRRARAGAPVNIIDQTELCDFTFGTIVNRAPVVIAHLDRRRRADARPVDPRQDRERAAARPLRLGEGRLALAPAGQAAPCRIRRSPRASGRASRARLGPADRAPTEADREKLLRSISAATRRGKVILVGAGPGDPELLTLKAVRALQSATSSSTTIWSAPRYWSWRAARRSGSRSARPATAPPAPVRDQRADGRARRRPARMSFASRAAIR